MVPPIRLPVVGDQNNHAFEFIESMNKLSPGINIKMICRLVKNKQVRPGKCGKPHQQACFSSPDSSLDFVIIFRVERGPSAPLVPALLFPSPAVYQAANMLTIAVSSGWGSSS